MRKAHRATEFRGACRRLKISVIIGWHPDLNDGVRLNIRPFMEANRVIPVRNEPHITQDGGATWFGGHAYPASGQKPGPRSAKACNGLVVTTTWHFYIDPFLMMRKSDNDAAAGALDTGAPWMRV
jgi:hypothetical protein